MGSKSMSNLIRDIAKRCLEEAPFFSHQHQQWRSYAARSFHRLSLSKPRPSKFSNPLFTLSFSSSTSKPGFVGWYLGVLDSLPLLTKSISSSLIYAAADFTSPLITSPASGSFDSMRTLRMAAYGLLILGPSQHLWFNFVSDLLPKRDLLTTLKKIFMGGKLHMDPASPLFSSHVTQVYKVKVVVRLLPD